MWAGVRGLGPCFCVPRSPPGPLPLPQAADTFPSGGPGASSKQKKSRIITGNFLTLALNKPKYLSSKSLERGRRTRSCRVRGTGAAGHGRQRLSSCSRRGTVPGSHRGPAAARSSAAQVPGPDGLFSFFHDLDFKCNFCETLLRWGIPFESTNNCLWLKIIYLLIRERCTERG